jgi:transmembrane sensor
MTESHRAPRKPPVLRAPIKDAIDVALSEADVQRMWRNLQGSAARPPVTSRRRFAAALRLPLRFAAIGAACALALSGALAFWMLQGKSLQTVGPLAVVGPGATRSGLGAAQTFGGTEPEQLSLDDGSRVELAGAARLEVLANTSRKFATRLRGGRCEFDVKPGGPRRWSIECGLVTVEVVGTHFTIERSARGVHVDVSRGVVVVRGEGVAEGARRLTAGQSLDVPAEAAAPSEERAAEPASAALANVPQAQSSAAAVPAAAAVVPTVERAGDGTLAAPPTLALSAASAELWLRQADEARRHGQRERAAMLLERVVQRAHDSPHAALAALTLARLLMRDEPARAAAALASVRDVEVPISLREDLMVRLVEARAREGRSDLAREAADRYTRVFPHGSRLDEVRQWTSTPKP